MSSSSAATLPDRVNEMVTIAEKYQSGRHPILIGDWRDGETGAAIEVRNPSTDEVIAEVAKRQHRVSFDDEARAVKLANDTEFGLIPYVYTEDLKGGLRLSGQMQSGMVALNGWHPIRRSPSVAARQAVWVAKARPKASRGLETKYIAVSL